MNLQRNPVTVAKLFARAWHAGQERKYTGEPYVVHCDEVAKIVETVIEPGTIIGQQMVCAAYLHDTLEDTKCSRTDIELLFGIHVMHLVLQLTNCGVSEGNRAARYKINCERLARASDEAQTIKLADLISNTSTIVKYDPGFAKLYLEEKEGVLNILTRGDKRLQERAWKILTEAKEELNRGSNAV